MSPSIANQSKSDFLLEKGMQMLWSKGYNATSVNDIVKAADVPKGSFYFYFDSKEDFVVKAIGKYFDRQFAEIDHILNDSSKSPKERLIRLHEYRIEILKSDIDCQKGCMACNLGSEMAEHSENIRSAITERENRYKDKIVSIMEEAQQLGEIDSSMDIRGVVEFLEDAGKGAMVTMKEKDSYEPIDNYYKMLRTYFLK